MSPIRTTTRGIGAARIGRLVLADGGELEAVILATGGKVCTAVEVECCSRPGQLEPVQVVRFLEDKAGTLGGGSARCEFLGGPFEALYAAQAGSWTVPAFHRSLVRLTEALLVPGEPDPEKQEEHDF